MAQLLHPLDQNNERRRRSHYPHWPMIGWSYLWGMYLCIFAFSSFYSSFYLPSISKVAYQRLRIPMMHYRMTRNSDLNYVTVMTDVIDQQSNTADVKYIHRNTARSRQCIGRVILTSFF